MGDFAARRQTDFIINKPNRKPPLQWLESTKGAPLPNGSFLVGTQNGKNLYIARTGNPPDSLCGPLVEGESLLVPTEMDSDPVAYIDSYKVLVIANPRSVHWVPVSDRRKMEGTISAGRKNGKNLLIGRVPYKRNNVTEWRVGMVSESGNTLACQCPCKDNDFDSVDMYTVDVEILCLKP
ncbi:hypothetical protein Ocin01_05137 [Orchesella cincta]|uniref:Uncharacterized protein n=1 Tax=Orchesella cincta TaxID=48709 RepID=A0A1D2N987_ORCCI|nr:hypothetical protein Ocin01_05137 [Orchesella cincta]